MYSPDDESLVGEAGISAGSEGVAIYEKMYREHLKTMSGRMALFVDVVSVIP